MSRTPLVKSMYLKLFLRLAKRKPTNLIFSECLEMQHVYSLGVESRTNVSEKSGYSQRKLIFYDM